MSGELEIHKRTLKFFETDYTIGALKNQDAKRTKLILVHKYLQCPRPSKNRQHNNTLAAFFQKESGKGVLPCAQNQTFWVRTSVVRIKGGHNMNYVRLFFCPNSIQTLKLHIS